MFAKTTYAQSRGYSILKSEQNLALSRRAFVGAAATVGAATALTIANPLDAYAVTAAEKKAEAQAAYSKLNVVQEKLNAASDEYYDALHRQEEAQANIEAAQDRIDEANDEISNLQEHLGTRARSMYRSGSTSFLDLLLGATSFTAFTNNWTLLNDMNEDDAEAVEKTKDLRAEIEEQKSVCEIEEAAAAEAKDHAEAAKNEAESLVNEYKATYNSLSAEAAQLLEQEKAAAEAANQRAVQNGNSGGGSNGGSKGGSGNKGSVNNNKKQVAYAGSIVATAYNALGCPYVWGAAGTSSFDCSGLVSYCYTGKTSHVYTSGTIGGWTTVTDPKPGDVCWKSGHVGIYIGGGQMIHAPTEGDVVKISAVQPGMIYKRL